MPVVSDADVLKLLAKGEIRIEPFRESNLTPNGYDVTIAETLVPPHEPVREGTAKIPSRRRFAVSTLEVFELGPGVTGELWLRTTWARRGVLASFGMVDSGFRGTLTLPAYNASEDDVEVPIGDRFAQIVFHMLSTASEKGYGERSGRYQDQRGVRLR